MNKKNDLHQQKFILIYLQLKKNNEFTIEKK